MIKSNKLLFELMRSNKTFISYFKNCLKEFNLNTKEFSKISGVPENTIYKIVSNNERDFRISTLKNIYNTFKKLEGTDDPFIAIITSGAVLDKIRSRKFKLAAKTIKLKEYPSITLEEIMSSAIKAEKEGAMGIICGPIAASSIRRLVSIPITAISFYPRGIDEAIDVIKTKI